MCQGPGILPACQCVSVLDIANTQASALNENKFGSRDQRHSQTLASSEVDNYQDWYLSPGIPCAARSDVA
jgi:hypothetical protein